MFMVFVFGHLVVDDCGYRSVVVENPRKRRKVEEGGLRISEDDWTSFVRDVQEFEVQHVQGKGKFAFGFVEGPLVKALRSGDWLVDPYAVQAYLTLILD
jgi:midasin